MTIKVLMASHLGSTFRYATIKTALQSIANQTRQPDEVLIAYSYKLDAPDEEEWKLILSPIPLRTVKSSTQQHQFHHYKNLVTMIDDDDLVCFLDDDDLYHPDKIQKVFDAYKSPRFKGVIKHRYKDFFTDDESEGPVSRREIDSVGSIFMMANTVQPSQTIHYGDIHHNEYCCYVVTGGIFKDFFETDHYNTWPSTGLHMLDVAFNVWLGSSMFSSYDLNEILLYVRKSLVIPRDYRSQLS